MGIIVTRIDERLIHGQVAYSWTVSYQISQIIVVDDDVAKDATQTMLLEMAVPSGKKHKILTIEEAVNYIKRQQEKERLFLVVKKPDTLLNLIEQGIEIPSINVGGMYYKPGKQGVGKTVYLDEHDKTIFQKLINMGINCEIRTAPDDKSVELAKRI